MLNTTASAKKKSRNVTEISPQKEIPSLGPSKPLEKKTYQNFAEMYESSGESDLNSSSPSKINQNEREKSYRSLVFRNKSRVGKENDDAKTPENKKNRSISESNVTNGAGTYVTMKKSKHSSISEDSANINGSQDASFLGMNKNKNKHLNLTYNPQITSTPTTDSPNKSKFEVTETGTPGKGNNKRNRKKSKSVDYVTPKKIKTDENKINVSEDTEKLKNTPTKTSSNKNKEIKRKVLKSETENQEQIGDTNNEAVSGPKKTRENRNKNKNVEQKFSDEGEEKTEKSSKKWNKHNKYIVQGANIEKTTLFVENLPINLMLKYKPILKKHFGKYGLIRNYGIIELYPTEDPRPVFSTTIRFVNEDSAEKALQEDNMLLEGKRIRVRAMLPAAQTTVVAKGKGLTEQDVSTIFSPCGRLRRIRIAFKGKHSIYQTAFVEFDGPEAVAKAMIIGNDASLGGKAIVVSKYEPRSVPEPPSVPEPLTVSESPSKPEPADDVVGEAKDSDEEESDDD